MTTTEQTQDQAAIDALRLALETRTPAQLMADCQDGDEAALDVVSHALVAIRKSLGLTVAEMLGRDLAQEMGLACPVEH